MPINDFVYFGSGVGSNVEAQATYVADTATLGGYLAGLAASAKLNKSWRQGSMASAALGQLVNSVLGIDFLDDGIINNKALQWWEMALTAGYFVDTGSASAVVIANPAGFTFAAPFPGQRISVKMASVPIGAVTLNWCSTGAVAATLGDLSAFQANDYAIGEILDFEFDGTRWQLISPSIGIIKRLGGPTSGGVPLTAPTTYYVNASTGVDTPLGGTVGAPWRTLQYAYNTVQSTYNAAGFVITFNCTGAFSAGVSLSKPITGAVGTSSVVFSFQAGASVSNSAGPCFIAIGTGVAASVGGTTTTFTASGTANLSTGVGCGILAENGAQVSYTGGVTFNVTCTAFGALGPGALCAANGNFTLSAVTMQAMFIAESFGEMFAAAGITATVGGANFTIAAVFCTVFGYNTQGGTTAITFSGSATGPRYSASLTSIIYTGASGASYYPGNSAGSVDATSVYG